MYIVIKNLPGRTVMVVRKRFLILQLFVLQKNLPVARRTAMGI
jgi:hypothetical protein